MATMARTLQVRDVPDDVHAALRARAALAGLSLSQYLLRTLTEVAERPTVAETLRAASQRTGGASAADVATVLAELRAR
jgi:plasmid stability protein